MSEAPISTKPGPADRSGYPYTKTIFSAEEIERDPEVRLKFQIEVRDALRHVLWNLCPDFEVVGHVSILAKDDPRILARGVSHFVSISGPREGIQFLQWTKDEDKPKDVP